MSDLFKAREKVEKGAQWRGDIDVSIDGEMMNLTVRQLRDPETWEVMSQINLDELGELQDELPEDMMEEYKELQDMDELDEDDEERLEEIQSELENSESSIFDVLSYETYKGLKKAAKYGTEPDEEDVRHALTTAEHINDIEEMYGGTNNEAAREYVNDQVINPMIERSTDFASFAIGVSVLGETLGDEGNSES